MERGAAQVITMVVQIVLARLLLPESFGAIAILLVFTNLANVFIQRGFSLSLIRKKEVSERDLNTVFVTSIVIAVCCAGVLCVFSPLIGRIYNMPGIKDWLRVLSLSLIIGAMYSVFDAIMVRQMQFKKIFLRGVLASALSGGIGIGVALLGGGVWALVAQAITNQIILCLVSGLSCEWKPKLEFSRQSFQEVFSFGSKILISELVYVGVEELRTLFIGKKYSAVDLAYYDRGLYYPAAAMRGIYDTITSVMLPVLSKEQENRRKMAADVETALGLSVYIVSPFFVGFAAVSELFVDVFLTEAWRPAVPFIQIFCIYELAFPLYGILRQSLYALGKSGSVLKLEIVKGALFTAAILAGLFFGTIQIAVFTCAALYLTVAVYTAIAIHHFPFRAGKVMKSVAHTFVLCGVMWLVVGQMSRIKLPGWLLLLTSIAVGAAVYVAGSVLTKHGCFTKLKSYLRQKH